MKVLRYILAFVLPPASVFLVQGVSTSLIISIVLTFLGWVPGMIHALWLSVQYDEAISSGGY